MAGVSATALCHLLCELYRAPTLWYYPLERRWAFELEPTGLAMAWFGRSLGSLAVGGCVFGLCWLAARSWSRGRKRTHRRPSPLGPALTALVLAGSIGAYVWHMVDHKPKPLPLPSWYVAR